MSKKRKELVCSVEDNITQSMGVYGYNVNTSRSFPNIYDGLKPIARRIIASLYDLGLTPNKPHVKVSKIVGTCLGQYHPHGDASIVDALVKMGQWFYLQQTWTEAGGCYGNITGDEHAAARYISSKMTPYCYDNIDDFKVAVEWIPNYDNTTTEPELIPVKYPNLLINGSFGIGVGFSTGIPCHNFKEVCTLAIEYIQNKEMTLDEMSTKIFPDYPTGGIAINGKILSLKCIEPEMVY